MLANVTIVGPVGGGYVTMFPGDVSAAPPAATVNPATNPAASFCGVHLPTTGANDGTAKIISIGAARDVIVDVVGYLR